MEAMTSLTMLRINPFGVDSSMGALWALTGFTKQIVASTEQMEMA
jgi:hypothetical protein